MRIILIFLSFILYACAPMSIVYYDPAAEGGKNVKSCGGPKDKIVFKVDKGVEVSVATNKKDSNIQTFFIRLSIPENSTVQFIGKEFSISDLEKKISFTVSPEITIDSWGYKEEFSFNSVLHGSLIKLPLWQSLNMLYSIEFTVTKLESDHFTLSLPMIKVNGVQITIPKITFEKKKGTYIYPINC